MGSTNSTATRAKDFTAFQESGYFQPDSETCVFIEELRNNHPLATEVIDDYFPVFLNPTHLRTIQYLRIEDQDPDVVMNITPDLDWGDTERYGVKYLIVLETRRVFNSHSYYQLRELVNTFDNVAYILVFDCRPHEIIAKVYH
jgi:hypothetical protein